MQTTEQQLKEVMGNTFGIPADQINDDTSVDTVEAWDSLKHLNLVLALEATFEVTFTEEQTVEMLNYLLVKMTLTEHGIAFVAAATVVN